MSRKNFKIFNPIFLFIIISLFFSMCAKSPKLDDVSKAKKKMSELEKYQEQIEKLKKYAKKQDEKKGPKLQKVGFLPFEYTVETGPEKSMHLLNSMAAKMIQRKSFHPASLMEWLKEDINKTSAKNIQEILSRARSTGIQVDYICHGRVYKSGPMFGALIALYPLKENLLPSYYYRPFPNFNAIISVGNDIVEEMEKRSRSPIKPIFKKTVFVNKFKKNFYTFTNIKTGEGSIIKIPYLTVSGTSYKTDEHFFSDVLVYNLHITRLFEVWNSNVKYYTSDISSIPGEIDYVVDADLDISQDVSLLTVKLINNRNKKVMFQYQYPFRSLYVQELSKAMRDNAKEIAMKLLTTEEKKYVGVVKLNEIDTRLPVYCENFYLGHGRQYDLILPAGQSNVKIENDKYKIFVSPYTTNNKLFKLTESRLLDLKK